LRRSLGAPGKSPETCHKKKSEHKL
jgi:hypothetical protein